MGYTTEFKGSFKLNRPLSDPHRTYLKKFARTRRMKRNASMLEEREDDTAVAAGLGVGIEGAYFVGADLEDYGQAHTDDILDYNSPPAGQPGLWCHWEPNEAGTRIEWDGGEKFYYYVEWLEYLIEHFLGPWGYKLKGHVTWKGEDDRDVGILAVHNNVVKVSR